jgi:hypothetical protein
VSTPTTTAGIIGVAAVLCVYFWRRRRGKFRIEWHFTVEREEERPGGEPRDTDDA